MALAEALKLPVQELLDLQREAAAKTDECSEVPGPGRHVGQWEPHALEIHLAGTSAAGSGWPEQRILPGYVEREHDRLLSEAVREAGQGRSRMLVLVGESSTGKTRACWEAVQPLAEKGWRLWHPFDPTRATAALEQLHRVGPRTVVWLNEAQHYLGDREHGEQIAAAVHALLVQPEHGPVLVLGTLWPHYIKQYTALPAAGGEDPHSRVRELLAGRTVNVPDVFDAPALAQATALAKNGDKLLADSLTRAHADGRLAQDLAGGPALLERYCTASPPAKALLKAAMDARRLGVGLHLPQTFLTDAVPDYLHDSDWDQLTEDWGEQAYAELAERVHGKQAPLRRINPRPEGCPRGSSASADGSSSQSAGPQFRLADYLEQHGDNTRRDRCPPASFWRAAHTHLTHPDDLDNIAHAAERRHRLQWAYYLRQRAADCGSTYALARLAWVELEAGDLDAAEALYREAADHGDAEALYRLVDMQVKAGDLDAAEALYREAADHGDAEALYRLVEMREEAGDREGAEAIVRKAADHGDTEALIHLAGMREEAGNRGAAEAFYREAADCGRTDALVHLAGMREEAGDREGAEALYREAADHGDAEALYRLVEMREEAGDREGAEAIVRKAADHGDTEALFVLARMREEAGDWDAAEALAREAADHGDTESLIVLARMRVEAGDWDAAEALAREAADHGNAHAVLRLAMVQEDAGDRGAAEALYREAADHGDAEALCRLAGMREEAGDREGAEVLYRDAAGHGSTDAVFRLAMMREKAGDQEGAEALAREAASHGDIVPLIRLADMREEAGGLEGAETLHREAADYGGAHVRIHSAGRERLWPHGLDPDGTPTPRWQ